jgi:hypothetical protein
LDRTFNALDETKKDSKPNGNPKGVPLAPSTSIVPQLGNGFWLSLVESLLQDDKPVMPKRVFLDLPVVVTKVPTVQDLRVKLFLVVLLVIPSLGLFFSLWK